MVLTSILFMLFAQDSPAGNVVEVQARAAAEGRQLAKKESESVPAGSSLNVCSLDIVYHVGLVALG